MSAILLVRLDAAARATSGSANIPRGAVPLPRSLAAGLDSLLVAAGDIVVIPAQDLSRGSRLLGNHLWLHDKQFIMFVFS